MVGVHNGLALIVRDQAQLPTGTQCKFVFHKASHTLRLYILKPSQRVGGFGRAAAKLPVPTAMQSTCLANGKNGR
jgi:hypothetical protein